MAGDNGRVHPVDDQQRLIGGRYRLSVQLGSGAMGTVWSGYDEVLRRRVAVKELKVPPGVPQREAMAMRERMLREARALGGLSHPNVITVTTSSTPVASRWSCWRWCRRATSRR